MTALQKRIKRVEEQLGSKRTPGLQLVITGAAHRLALDSAACVEILEGCGYLRETDAVSVARLIDIPDGLDVKGTERFLRERGAEICSPSRHDRVWTAR